MECCNGRSCGADVDCCRRRGSGLAGAVLDGSVVEWCARQSQGGAAAECRREHALNLNPPTTVLLYCVLHPARLALPWPWDITRPYLCNVLQPVRLALPSLGVIIIPSPCTALHPVRIALPSPWTHPPLSPCTVLLPICLALPSTWDLPPPPLCTAFHLVSVYCPPPRPR